MHTRATAAAVRVRGTPTASCRPLSGPWPAMRYQAGPFQTTPVRHTSTMMVPLLLALPLLSAAATMADAQPLLSPAYMADGAVSHCQCHASRKPFLVADPVPWQSAPPHPPLQNAFKFWPWKAHMHFSNWNVAVFKKTKHLLHRCSQAQPELLATLALAGLANRVPRGTRAQPVLLYVAGRRGGGFGGAALIVPLSSYVPSTLVTSSN